MFRQRTSSQKPGDDLLANFRQQFPEVAVATSSSAIAGPACAATTAGQAGADIAVQERSLAFSHAQFKDQDPTPRASEPWRFTPSLLDPNAFSFANFPNQPPGYYTPTPGGTNTIYRSETGILHTPTLSLEMGLGTPLSIPTTEGAIHSGAGSIGLGGFHDFSDSQSFHNIQTFGNEASAPAQPTSFSPSTFLHHHDTGYETMDHDGSPMDSEPTEDRLGSIENTLQDRSPLMDLQARQFGMGSAANLPSSIEKFRFHATLNAPTAMIKHADEIPITYLNKGQAYSLSVVDTTPALPIAPGTRFRTFVRVSFEDEEQRQKPGVCWGLWKAGRGTNEAHLRGGKLQAVVYVEAVQPGHQAEDEDKRARVELETASFDGFSVIWTPTAHGVVECSLAVRFNFLSTDFSHSKGVKGIPVRFCTKTHPLPLYPSQPAPESTTEIMYCKVKLFRDHGAERKLLNDVAHVKKAIDKVKQQIAQAESGMKDFVKRKKSGASHVKGMDSSQRPGKAPKHKRAWSMSSASSAGGEGGRSAPEEDLHFKLQTLQDMFTSTRPVSVLFLRGEKGDDPDLHPVSLPGEPPDLKKLESRDSLVWRSERGSTVTPSVASRSPSSLSLHSQVSNAPWQDRTSRQVSAQPTRIKQLNEAGKFNGWIEAMGVDSSYRPPVERTVKPVACFYVARRDPGNPAGQEMHKAIYLMQRSLREFVTQVAAKWNLDTGKIIRIVHVLKRGLEVEMDDDAIRELSEGQDMVLEVREAKDSAALIKREWEMAVDTQLDPAPAPLGSEFRLTF